MTTENSGPQFFDAAPSDAEQALASAITQDLRQQTRDSAPSLDERIHLRLSNQYKGARWLTWGLSILALFFVGVMIVDSVLTLMTLAAIHPWLGYAATGVLGIAAVCLTLAVMHELGAGAALRRSIEAADRARVEQATGQLSSASVKRLKTTIERLAETRNHPCRAQLESALALINEHDDAGHGVETQLTLIEREALAPLDLAAQKEIKGAFARATWTTMVSPFAILDAGLALHRSLVLNRRLAMIYGGVPSSLASTALIRRTFEAMLVAGTLEASDTLLANLFGGGILAKMSAKLGEGLVSGLMTARLGLAAQRLLRPLPFRAQKAPSLADMTPDLLENLKQGSQKA